jgi:UDP-N-acetylglucosamine 1-carboxyvinyltransferase
MVTQDGFCSTGEPALLGADSLFVTGGRRLAGEVRVGGFKHSLVTVLAATCAARAPAVITNCPAVAETTALAGLINDLGGRAEYVAGTLTVDTAEMTGGPIEDRGIHGSVYLAPALLTRSGHAAVPTGGGCQIGDSPAGRRPVDQYVAVLSRFGATVTRTDDQLLVRATRLTGCEIDLLDYTSDRARRTGPLYSGASKMAILAAAVAHGTSVLHNPYPKPDVTNLVTVLRAFGADVETTAAGSLVVHGRGPDALDRQVRHDLVADLIEVVTWICAGALLAGTPLRVHGPNLAGAMTALHPELAVFTDLGVQLDLHGDELTVHPAESLFHTDVVVTSPGVFSDSHPLLALLMTAATGRSTITETVWSTRFGYQPGLEALGARLARHGTTITIDGPCRPSVPGERIHAPDLRAAAALLLAALHVEGSTLVTGTHHLARGYPDFVGSLRGLGAVVENGSVLA